MIVRRRGLRPVLPPGRAAGRGADPRHVAGRRLLLPRGRDAHAGRPAFGPPAPAGRPRGRPDRPRRRRPPRAGPRPGRLAPGPRPDSPPPRDDSRRDRPTRRPADPDPSDDPAPTRPGPAAADPSRRRRPADRSRHRRPAGAKKVKAKAKARPKQGQAQERPQEAVAAAGRRSPPARPGRSPVPLARRSAAASAWARRTPSVARKLDQAAPASSPAPARPGTPTSHMYRRCPAGGWARSHRAGSGSAASGNRGSSAARDPRPGAIVRTTNGRSDDAPDGTRLGHRHGDLLVEFGVAVRPTAVMIALTNDGSDDWLQGSPCHHKPE